MCIIVKDNKKGTHVEKNKYLKGATLGCRGNGDLLESEEWLRQTIRIMYKGQNKSLARRNCKRRELRR